MSSTQPFLIRDAQETDMAAVRAIYGFYVLTSAATFEETLPELDKMLARRRASVDAGLPYLVAVTDGAVVGFAYAGEYRTRPAYRHTVEDSVYVAPERRSHGIGRALLAEVIARCQQGDWRQMVAVVGGSDNLGSVALHRELGFELVGTLRDVGYKFERWVDTPLLQRALRRG